MGCLPEAPSLGLFQQRWVHFDLIVFGLVSKGPMWWQGLPQQPHNSIHLTACPCLCPPHRMPLSLSASQHASVSVHLTARPCLCPPHCMPLLSDPIGAGLEGLLQQSPTATATGPTQRTMGATGRGSHCTPSVASPAAPCGRFSGPAWGTWGIHAAGAAANASVAGGGASYCALSPDTSDPGQCSRGAGAWRASNHPTTPGAATGACCFHLVFWRFRVP